MSVQCDPTGKCRCKPGVEGDKCDRCIPNYYDLTSEGCRPCECDPVGSVDWPASCDPFDGTCRCKAYVEGKNCDRLVLIKSTVLYLVHLKKSYFLKIRF